MSSLQIPEPSDPIEIDKIKRQSTRADQLSTVAVVIAVVFLVGIIWQTRPWDRGVDTNDEIGLTGGAAGAPRPGDNAPDFTLPRANGTSLELSDLRGRAVFLNFWATWCTFCIEEMPDMQRIADQYGDDLVVLGVNAGNSVEEGSSFAERVGAQYELVYDTSQEVVRGYRVRAMPTSYFITPNGEIIDAQFGFMTYDDMVEKVDRLLERSGKATQ